METKKYTTAIAAATLILLGTGCGRTTPLVPPLRGGSSPVEAPLPNELVQFMVQKERVEFQTSDGVTIVGDYYFASQGEGGDAKRPFSHAKRGGPAVLLLHMMPATRDSYAEFADRLVRAGYRALAIDFRGHGESVQGSGVRDQVSELDYKNFSDQEQQAKILDVRAAVDWLMQEKGVKKEQLVLVGASIGANLALQYLVENPEVPAAVLLSSGLDYRGVRTPPLAQLVKPTQALYFAASADDEYSLNTNRALYAVTPAQKQIKEFQAAGHGTTMFEREPEFISEVIEWIRAQVK